MTAKGDPGTESGMTARGDVKKKAGRSPSSLFLLTNNFYAVLNSLVLDATDEQRPVFP